MTMTAPTKAPAMAPTVTRGKPAATTSVLIIGRRAAASMATWSPATSTVRANSAQASRTRTSDPSCPRRSGRYADHHSRTSGGALLDADLALDRRRPLTHVRQTAPGALGLEADTD